MSDSSDTDNIEPIIIPEKKRGRKKKKKPIENEVSEVKKKRGRKKKWEVETTSKMLENTPVIFNTCIDNKTNSNNSNDLNINNNYEQQDISFGNLNIKLHTNKETQNTVDILQNLKNNSNTKINLEYKNNNLKNNNNKNNNKNIEYKTIKVMTHYKTNNDFGEQIYLSNIKCYNCHHNFKNEPYFLPISYCALTKRYKITGNFCSPNCVKRYAITYHNNIVYLISFMYKELFGYTYIIKTAPPFQVLKEYGGNLSIEEYRNSFNKNVNYSLKNINTKVICDEIITK